MKRIIALLMLAALTGCGAATRAATSATAPPPDTTRQACHALSGVDENDIDAQFDPDVWGPIAELARTARSPKVATAGTRLAGIVAANQTLPESDRAGRPNTDLMRAELDLATACGGVFGDGPW